MSNSNILDSIISIVEAESQKDNSSFDSDELGSMLLYLRNVKSTVDYFDKTDKVMDFVNEHISQMTDAEEQHYTLMTKDELFQHAFFEGILNGLVMMGFDFRQLDSTEVSKEELDKYYNGEKEL